MCKRTCWVAGLLLLAAGCSRGPKAVNEVVALETVQLPAGPPTARGTARRNTARPCFRRIWWSRACCSLRPRRLPCGR